MDVFKDCYLYSDVKSRILNSGDRDTIVELDAANSIYGDAESSFIIRKIYDFGSAGAWIAHSADKNDSSHYCFDKKAQEWLTINEDWWTGKWSEKAEKKNVSNSHKTAHTNYSIDYVIERLIKAPLYTAETVDYLYRIKDEGYSLVCWSSINGWVAINCDVAENTHADIKRFSYYDASVLEECYNKGELD